MSADGPPESAFDRIPELDGTLLLDEATRQAYAQDFGQIVSEQPDAVLRPGSVDDIARMLRFARRHGIRVVGRGAAHTTFGQSQHPASIVFDLTSLDSIGPIADGCITVDAGCRWNAVLAKTLAHDLMPPVLPDYIGQTIGGTLSVGGIGAMSFREGAQIDHVVALRAVTGNGEIVRCSPRRHRELFEMLLAGQGQVGVIVEATLRLVSAPRQVRLYDLIYADLDHLLTDIRMLMEDERFDQMESFIIPTGPGTWLYLLEAIGFHSATGPPDDAALLDGLGHVAAQTQTDLEFLEWSSRVPTDLPRRPNPWIDLLLPMSDAATFLEEVQATITPVVPGDAFSLLLIPLRASRFTRPLFRTQDEELGLGFDPLRALPPAPPSRRRSPSTAACTTAAAGSAARSTRSARCASTPTTGPPTMGTSGTGYWPPSAASTAATCSPAGPTSSTAPSISCRRSPRVVDEAAAGQEQWLDPHDRGPGAVDERFEAGLGAT